MIKETKIGKDYEAVPKVIIVKNGTRITQILIDSRRFIFEKLLLRQLLFYISI